MGLKGYFKSAKKEPEPEPQSQPHHATPQTMQHSSFDPYSEKITPPLGPSAYGSRRTSFAGSTRSQRSTMMEDIRHEVMVNYLFQQQCAAMWIGDGSGEFEGVLVRKSRSRYLACPPDLLHSTFAIGCAALNLPCAMTINSRVVKTYLAWSPDALDVPLKNGLRVQVLPCMEELPRARKAQSAAFIAADGLLVVWDDGEFRRIYRVEQY